MYFDNEICEWIDTHDQYTWIYTGTTEHSSSCVEQNMLCYSDFVH